MTLQELIEATSNDKGRYWGDTLILVNGIPADDFNLGLIGETGQLTLNILSYETH